MRLTPASAGLGLRLRPESGAMMATSPGVSISSSTQGGMLKGLKRSVRGGESLFKNLFGGEGGSLVHASGRAAGCWAASASSSGGAEVANARCRGEGVDISMS